MREGLSLIIDAQPDMRMIASAATGEEGVDLFCRCRPDIVLMDLQLPSMTGLQAMHRIRLEDPVARIIVLTMYQGDEDIHRALQAGAITYVLKDALTQDLIRIVREVHAGEHPILPDIDHRLADRLSRSALTTREVEILKLLATGMRNKEIASVMGISEETLKVHNKHIYAKLRVNDRTAAVTTGLQHGIIHLPTSR